MEIIKEGEYYITLNYYWYGVTYYGSYKNMRFMIKREPSANLFYNSEERNNTDAKIVGKVWPEPFCLEKTKPELVITEENPFTEEGIEELRQWINNQYDKNDYSDIRL